MNVSGSGRTVTDVAVDITVECVDDRGLRHQIDSVLGYRRDDPYAVTMTFITGEGNLTWTFARELLARGIARPTGDGDVHVAPTIGVRGRAIINVELTSPDGHLMLQVRTAEMSEFLGRTFAVVPDGDESAHFDVDEIIAQALAS